VPTYNTDQILTLAQMKPVAVIGGARTYGEFMPYADKMILSVIDGDFDADVVFPIITPKWSWPAPILPKTKCNSSGHVWSVWEVTRGGCDGKRF
jgi:dihydrofolate reductase